jgi:hypothetical protein
MQATNDAQIRELLIPFVRLEHATSDLILFEEFALYGGANRADVAALNGISHGYEIKSARDTLVRLPRQVDAYNAVFERATLVSSPKHLEAALKLIPVWWGIVEVREDNSLLCLQRVRDSEPNPSPDGIAIASLLWRPEALNLLASLGLDKGIRSKNMEHIIERLAVELPPERLARYVREALRARGDWKAAARLKRYDARPRQPASAAPTHSLFPDNTGRFDGLPS